MHCISNFGVWKEGGAEEEEGDISLEITKRLGMYHDRWFYKPRITMSLVGIWNSNILTWIVDTDAQLMNATVPSQRIQWVFSGDDKSAEGVWENNGKYLFVSIESQLNEITSIIYFIFTSIIRNKIL